MCLKRERKASASLRSTRHHARRFQSKAPSHLQSIARNLDDSRNGTQDADIHSRSNACMPLFQEGALIVRVLRIRYFAHYRRLPFSTANYRWLLHGETLANLWRDKGLERKRRPETNSWLTL